MAKLEYIVLAPQEGVPAEFLYCLARNPAFVDYPVKNMNGSSGRREFRQKLSVNLYFPKFQKGIYMCSAQMLNLCLRKCGVIFLKISV